MSEEQQDAIIGRTLKEYQAAKKSLAVLHAEAEYLGEYLSAVGHALRTNHDLNAGNFGNFSGTVDVDKWPNGEKLKGLSQEVSRAKSEKQRLAEILKNAGFEQPE